MSVPPGPGPRLARTLISVALLLLPVVAGASLYLWQASERDGTVEAAQRDDDAVRAAKHEVLTWASVDYQKLDDYFTQVKAGATGEFLDQFEQTESTLRQGLTENESVQVPTIPRNGVALLERTGDQARVIVAIDAVVTNLTTNGKPQPRQYRMQATMQEIDGKWLISKLEYVG